MTKNSLSSLQETSSQTNLKQEIAKRRSFAVIAHPDAGKTTLTEKMLLYGGAVHLAGHVRARRDRRKTRSDWMKLEQERGISISSTVLQFSYQGFHLNLLDTPGHEDFSEDTYRTLTAVDTAIMLLDAARGVQEQTIKLFEVCREKKIPIITFINKVDLPTGDLFGVIDSIEKTLGMTPIPFTWPLGTGRDLNGIYDLRRNQIYRFQSEGEIDSSPEQLIEGFQDPSLRDPNMDAEEFTRFQEGGEICQSVLSDYREEFYLSGKQTPVFFGSAAKNAGIRLFLDSFMELGLSPRPLLLRDKNILQPDQKNFSGFAFKLQANMNHRHRDRVAFIRITSGKFTRGMSVYHSRFKKSIRLLNAVSFFGQERQTIDTAYAGDIIGLTNPGLFQIGDIIAVQPTPLLPIIPRFAPEIFTRLISSDTSKLKSFRRGLEELAEEGVVQVFKTEDGRPVLGAIGNLQFDTFCWRLENEYHAPCNLEPMAYECSRWFHIEDSPSLSSYDLILYDLEKRPVVLFRSLRRLQSFQKDNPKIKLSSHPPLKP